MLGLGEFLMESGGICAQWTTYLRTMLTMNDDPPLFEEILDSFTRNFIIGSPLYHIRQKPAFAMLSILRTASYSILLVASNCADLHFAFAHQTGKINVSFIYIFILYLPMCFRSVGFVAHLKKNFQCTASIFSTSI